MQQQLSLMLLKYLFAVAFIVVSDTQTCARQSVFYGEALARYGFGGSHPFGTDRLDAFWNKLQSESIDNIVVEEPGNGRLSGCGVIS